MRKFLALALTVLMLTTLFAGATAEVTLTSSMFMTAEYLPEESTMDEETGAYHEVLTYDDGMMRIDLVGQPIPADGSAVRAFYGVTETGKSAEAVAEWIEKRMGRK